LETVNLAMPKFSIDTELDLNSIFKEISVLDAFSPGQSDFSGMNGDKDLYISGVFHKALIDVNEEGTEAAAATAVVVGTTSAPKEVITLTLDKPFIFLIQDEETGSVLFIGRVANPAA
jgi:serpin B